MGKRADSGDGSCCQVQTGRHEGKWRVQFIQTMETGKRQRLSRLFATKAEARAFLKQLRHGIKVETCRRSAELTLGAWFAWLATNDWPEALAEVTIIQRQRRFAKYVHEHLGGVPLAKIDPLVVRAFYRHLRDSGASDNTVLMVKSDLVRTFNQAIVPYGRVPATMANPFRLALQHPKPREAVALTPDQVRLALRPGVLDPSRRAMLGVLVLAGLRLGEMMALTRQQIRLDDGLIVIDRAVQVAFGGKQTVGLPKGGKTRCAVLCATLEAILRDHVASLASEDLLWPAVTGNQPRMKKLVYATWRTILRDAQLPAELSPHDCRLSHINVIEKLMPEVSVTTLKEHVGHAATGVTEANYTRPMTASQSILRFGLDQVLGKGD